MSGNDAGDVSWSLLGLLAYQIVPAMAAIIIFQVETPVWVDAAQALLWFLNVVAFGYSEFTHGSLPDELDLYRRWQPYSRSVTLAANGLALLIISNSLAIGWWQTLWQDLGIALFLGAGGDYILQSTKPQPTYPPVAVQQERQP